MNFFQRHRTFVLLYGAVFLYFLWPCIFLQKTFIFGDYWQQHYPWAYEYARALKAGTLPYWLPQVGNGFPLVAEGQVGAYYLPHLVMYLVLPFFAAYTWGIVLHMLAGGIGSYVYGQKAGLSKDAAVVFALLFSFSSAYGGCFSNTAVVRVMAWLPWFLYGWEALGEASKRKRLYWTIVLGFFFSQMATAGAPQMALYAAIYLFLFCLLKSGGRHTSSFLAAGVIGAALSLPQWAATLELAPLSARAGETASFAMSGSVMPPSFASLFFPEWGTFLGVSFYLGAATACLLFVSVFSRKKYEEKIHWGLAILFVLMALGKYNPVYAFLIEKGPLTFLRTPSKWLFFSAVSLSMAACYAFDRLERLAQDGKFSDPFRKGLVAAALFIASAPLLAQTAYSTFRRHLADFVRQSAQALYAGKTDPLHDASYYQGRAAEMLGRLEALFAYSNPWNLTAIGFLLLSAFVLWKALEKNARVFWRRTALLAVLAADLLVFGTFIGTGFTGNVRDTPEALPASIAADIRQRQDSNGSSVIGWADGKEQEVLPANVNLLYGLKHAGAYSPLILKRYYEFSKKLGISDSSLGRRPYSEEVWNKEAGAVEALGIGQVLSERPLSLTGSRLVSVAERRMPGGPPHKEYLYEMEIVRPWARLSHEDPASPGSVRFVSRQPLEIDLETEDENDARLILRSSFYPRWKALVDGKPAEVTVADEAFSGIALTKGKHAVRFYYDVSTHRLWEGVSLAVFVFLSVAALRLRRAA